MICVEKNDLLRWNLFYLAVKGRLIISALIHTYIHIYTKLCICTVYTKENIIKGTHNKAVQFYKESKDIKLSSDNAQLDEQWN